jgi:integrase
MLEAFFGVMYYAGPRPGEVVNLRRSNLRLPEPTRNDDGELQYGWGELVFERSAPATGAAWTDSGTRREARQLKGSEVGERRVAPSPPELTRLLTRHLTEHGTDDEGRLFRGVQTGARSPRVRTAGSGRRLVRPLSALRSAPHRWPLGPTTFDMPACPHGSTPGCPAPGLPSGQGTAWTSRTGSTRSAWRDSRTPSDCESTGC